MNRNIWKYVFVIALILPSGIHAQSLKDLLNKENIERWSMLSPTTATST